MRCMRVGGGALIYFHAACNTASPCSHLLGKICGGSLQGVLGEKKGNAHGAISGSPHAGRRKRTVHRAILFPVHQIRRGGSRFSPPTQEADAGVPVLRGAVVPVLAPCCRGS